MTSLPTELERHLDSLYDNPGSRIHPRVTTPGHTLPQRDRLVGYDVHDPVSLAELRQRHGCDVVLGASSSGNVVFVDRDLKVPKLKLELLGVGALCVFGRNAAVGGRLILGDESLVVLSGQAGGRMLQLNLTLRSRNERVFWGSGSSSEGLSTSVKGDDVAIVVGDDCMFSWGIWVRPSDMHLIIDPVAGTVINDPRDVIVGPHVWVGQNSLLLKGSEIGAGSIIAANTVVSGLLDPMGVYAGVPAKQLRAGVTWDRDSQESPAAIERARQVYATYGPGG